MLLAQCAPYPGTPLRRPEHGSWLGAGRNGSVGYQPRAPLFFRMPCRAPEGGLSGGPCHHSPARANSGAQRIQSHSKATCVPNEYYLIQCRARLRQTVNANRKLAAHALAPPHLASMPRLKTMSRDPEDGALERQSTREGRRSTVEGTRVRRETASAPQTPLGRAQGASPAAQPMRGLVEKHPDGPSVACFR